jgi:N-methylhydantoinase A
MSKDVSHFSRRLPRQSRQLDLGIDVGGTFTDIIVHDSGGLSVLKIPTSSDPSSAVVKGLLRLGSAPRRASLISHATTLATNALLTHAGLARTALVTNDGFRDILEIGRQRRPEIYDLNTRRPPPLVERRDRLTAKCRIAADGTELEPLNLEEAEALAKRVVDGKFESIAICFLNSFLNDIHERQVKDFLLSRGFRGHISISTDVDRAYREYERTSTTVVNAVLSPLMAGYLSSLRASLSRSRIRAPVYVMGSDGGASTIAFASSRPVSVIESGPAAGVIASKVLAGKLSLDRVLTFDMGGTTAKAGTVIDGEPDIIGEFEAAGRTHSGQSIKGSGYPVRGQFIDLAEVSAGGGTVAWADEAGELKAGPRSAGSDPGPACYGRGGREPTVTDASVLLGRLSPEALLGGAMKIKRELAVRSISKLAVTLQQTPEECAKGILRLVNDSMARAISLVSLERGRDPRDFTLVAFGGAGPMHACDLAEEMGVTDVVVPIHAGLFSAYGLLVGELTRSFSAPVTRPGNDLQGAFRRLEENARRNMHSEGFGTIRVIRFVEARYVGQSHELQLPYRSEASLRGSFDKRHKELYGFSTRDQVEVVSIKVTAIVPRPAQLMLKSDRNHPRAHSRKREAWIGGRNRRVSVFPGESLLPGSHGAGPCIIEEYDSTLVVNPSWRWRAEEYGTRMTR